ncbi:multidrug resistance-associated protein 1-like isoform X2 [Trichoplusia ni]|uniref:ABC-type glutathione-S-conjugate transporter n=1 Tax=Trichoplusia ni TaxID=7111 RepID=A0A7E5VWE8_TRINI|nr:multidrug resistance-associated protein 1-like isoform X2 [Trichoplusia ni]
MNDSETSTLLMPLNSSMDHFCGSVFWNSSLTWYSDNPDFTPCFQKTVLVWIPCMFLWLAALIDGYHIYSSKEFNIPWNKLNISKLIIICLLCILQIVNICQVAYKSKSDEIKVFDVDYYDPGIKLLTFILSATLVYYNRKYGIQTSGVLFIFWFLLILAGLPELRSNIVNYNTSDDVYVRYNIFSYIVYYTLNIIMFVLNCFADLPPRNTPYIYGEVQSPEKTSGFPSKLTFSWFDPLAFTGYRRTLTKEDLWPLHPQLMSKEVVPKFNKFWQKSLKKQEVSKSSARTSVTQGKRKQETKPVSILPVVCLAFGGQFLFAIFLKVLNDILIFASPELLKHLIGFIEGKEPMWRGYAYAVGMFVCAILQSLLLGQYFFKVYTVGIKVKNSLSSVVYKKALCLSNSARKESTVGEIINLMSTDVDRFSNLTFVNLIWSAPLQISLALYFLWGVLGPSVLAGVAVIVILMPMNGLMAKYQQSLQTKLMAYKDERVKLMNEVLNGIKVLKMYAWEPSFQEHIVAVRNKELAILKKLAYYSSGMSFIWSCTPFLVSLMSFTCFVLVNDKEVLDSQRAFVALSLFNILRFPMSMLPNVIADIIQTAVSIKRLNKFLNAEELDTTSIEHNDDEKDQILIENGFFTWGDHDSEPVLKNINLHIPRGSLVAVVGGVGSGKSSLLSALLGDMDKLSGRINIKGNIAYASQQAWIQNATVQNNILFDKPLVKNKYNDIIEACALKSDLDILPGGDQTEIGEKGINLSGGQKQRVSLARAVYYDANNYFLDDPLSAVDSHVGKHIFDKVIGPAGLLKGKTRVWVTHNVSYLAQTDLVVVLRDGEVSEAGSYQQLLEKKGAFAEFLLHYLTKAEQSASMEDLETIKHDLENQLGSEFHRKLEWARSLSRVSEAPSEPKEAGDHNDTPTKEKSPDIPEEVEKEFDQLIEKETLETGKVKGAVYKHYLSYIGVWSAVWTLVMFVLLQAFQIGSNFWLARWSNDDKVLVNGTVDTQRRDMYLGVYGGLGFGQAITSFVTDLLPFLACWKAAKMLHAIMLDNVLRTPLQFFEVTPIGRILSRFSKDVDAVDSSLPWQISSVLFGSFEVVGTIFVISYSTPMFMTVIIPIGALYYLIQRFYVPTSRQIMRIESVWRSPVYSHFNESILGATSIRAFGVTDRFVQESQQKVDNYQSICYLSSIADRWLGIRLEIVGSLVIFFAALFAVIGRESISPGLAGLSVSYTLEITQMLSWLVQMTSAVETEIVAVERMKEYSETKQEAAWSIASGPPATWPETGALQLERLSLAYRAGAEPALRDVTCAVAPRDKLGIVGRTGAGKSTLTLGLFRIVEAVGGRILIDGLDIASIGLHQLRARITIIPQDPVLFSGTLRMNLDPFETYTDDQIWRALELAHLKPFVLGLAAGLRHEVAEGGENLSVGQRQLVCLARALLRKTPLLVLDEATAAVDLETDELIQKTIRKEFASCTVITIAHRLNTIMDSTKVMVLDKGQLMEFAPPQELLQDKNSMFYSLAKDAGLVN